MDRGSLDQAVNDRVGICDVLLQEVVPGVGLGVYALCSHGEVISEVHQVRLHEPAGGGGGTLRTTIEKVPKASKSARRILGALGWTGPVMVEFRWNPATDELWLMEVNCRFWGSLSLTIRAGMEFPAWELHRSISGTYPLDPRHASPKIGVLQRHLQGDLGWQRMRRQGSHDCTPRNGS